MNYCSNPNHKNDPDWSYTSDGCPYCRIEQLEQKLIGWPDLFDENMLLQVRVQELELDLAEYQYCVKQATHSHAVKKAMEYRQQNAKLVEALESYAECSHGCTCGDGWSHDIAAAALKEMEVGNE